MSITARSSSPTETDPLLPPHPVTDNALAQETIHDEHVPWLSLFPMVLYRIVDSATYLIVFPFITELLLSLRASPARVGLYAGLAEGSLMLSEAITVTTWAKLTDLYGRKPVLIIGFAISVCPSVLVAFSTKVWHVILLRALGGVLYSMRE